MAPELIEYSPGHVAEIEPNLQEGVAIGLEKFKPLEQHAETLGKMGHAWTARVDDRVIAIGGVVDRQDGDGEGWFLTTPEVRSHARWLIEITNAMLAEMGRMGLYRRILASVDAEFAKGVRFVEALGFSFVGDHEIDGRPNKRVERCL